MLDQLHRDVESADANDAIPVADVAIVEDQVARGCVVADIADVWVGSCWCAVGRQPPRKCRNLLDVVEVVEGQGKRQLGGEVALSASRAVITVSAMVILIGVSSTSLTLRQILPGWDALSVHLERLSPLSRPRSPRSHAVRRESSARHLAVRHSRCDRWRLSS